MARIEPLLPDRTPRRGGRWRTHRQIIDAIAFKYRTGMPWSGLPEEFGSWTSEARLPSDGRPQSNSAATQLELVDAGWWITVVRSPGRSR
ncbi:transposase [Streptomyces sp. NBC_01017]|uniref:transposase n=1 Tax=Streptomyces sp. NBC_01017 TaxID=2903721 RepID=UPI00386689FD